jgi:hypothetical protein
MPSLLTHALEQEICLPVAHLLVLVQTVLQPQKGAYTGASQAAAGRPRPCAT